MSKSKEASPSSPPEAPPEQAAFDLRIEAALLTTDRPLTAAKLSDLLDSCGTKAVNEGVARLNESYTASGRSFRIEQVAGGWQMLTQPQFADTLAKLHKTSDAGRLSPAAMETLAIIAYKQPILRANVEAIRGVASGEVIRSLMERHLVKIVGRAEELGRPMLYGTTKAFLEAFGLSAIRDLPRYEEFNPKKPAAKAAAAEPDDEQAAAAAGDADAQPAPEPSDTP